MPGGLAKVRVWTVAWASRGGRRGSRRCSRRRIRGCGPSLCIGGCMFGLGLVAGHDPDVAAPGLGGLADAVVGVRIGEADLPAFGAKAEGEGSLHQARW